MQRHSTRQSPGANAAEKAHMRWVKERGICIACGNDGGVICHHFAGSSAKKIVHGVRIHFGHWAVNGLCQNCDDIVTHKGRPAFRSIYGNECDLWKKQALDYPIEIPISVICAISMMRK